MSPDALTDAEMRVLQRPPAIPPVGPLDAQDLTRLGALVLAVVQMSVNGNVQIRWQRELGEFHVAMRVNRHKKACACGHCPRHKGERRLLTKSRVSLVHAFDLACEQLRTSSNHSRR